MAQDENVQKLSIAASADLSASQFKLVELSSGKAAIANASTDIVIGVLLNKPTAVDMAAEIAIGGRSKCLAGAAVVTPGTQVMTDATGRAIAATATNRAFGTSLTAAAAAGDVFEVAVGLIRPVVA
jgi:hypothetical protein